MDTQTTELPQPIREAFVSVDEVSLEYEVDPVVAEALDTVEDDQSERPVASDSPAKLGITAVRQLDERIGVMIQRINAFRVFAAKHGVDENTNSPSLIKREIVHALGDLDQAETLLRNARFSTTTARETLESL